MGAEGTQQHKNKTKVRILTKVNHFLALNTSLKGDKSNMLKKAKIVKVPSRIFRLFKIRKIKLNSFTNLISEAISVKV